MSVIRQANIISQASFDQLLSSYYDSMRFADLLQSNGYDTILENIQIAPNHSRSIDFSDCHFKNVTLSGNLSSSTFNHSSFYKVEFSNANLSASTFENSSMEQSKSIDSSFNDVLFLNSSFRNDSFYHCDFSNSAIVNSNFNKSIISKSNLTNTVDFRNNATDLHLVFNQPYQQDSVFKNAQTHYIKPTVAIVDDNEWYGTPYYKLGEYGAIPKTVSQYNFSIDDSQLEKEVKKVFNDIEANGLNDNSIAEQVINSGQPLIQSIKEYAYQIMSESDAVWIPGGPDLHTEFYNEKNTESYPSGSYYREILEFSITQAAIALDKPILGICHGSQLVNVFLGGSLHQHVDTPYGHVNLTSHTNEGLIGSVIEDKLIGPSYHHQAVNRIADSLEVVATYDGVIKATQATDGKKIMLCQFHPEYEADKSSVNILNQFISISSEHKFQSTLLKLADVIDMSNDIVGLDPVQNTKPATFAPACAQEACITQHLPILQQPTTEMVFC